MYSEKEIKQAMNFLADARYARQQAAKILGVKDGDIEKTLAATLAGAKTVTGYSKRGGEFAWTVTTASDDKEVDNEKAMAAKWLANGGERITMIRKGSAATLRKA